MDEIISQNSNISNMLHQCTTADKLHNNMNNMDSVTIQSIVRKTSAFLQSHATVCVLLTKIFSF